MKILVLAGTRPEAVKVAPIIMELSNYKQIDTIVCNTGQHKEMLQQAFDDFKITPDLFLDVMQPKQTLASLSSRLFQEVDRVLVEYNPSWILIQGDTTTVMVSALCAFYRSIKVGHIEAGLRSFDKFAPFPEEVNREIVSKVADLHFAPTKIAYENLIREGADPDDAVITGNTVIDALLWMHKQIAGRSELLDSRVRQAMAAEKKIILVTGHRRENFGDGFIEICHALRSLADTYTNVVFVYPVHLNPQVQEPVHRLLADHPRIILLSPLSYKHFVALLDVSYFVLTDSGGVQEEAPAMGKPVLVMRDVTERPEGVKAGVAKLVGAHQNLIVKHVSLLLENDIIYTSMAKAQNPYGDGFASQRIIQEIIKRNHI